MRHLLELLVVVLLGAQRLQLGQGEILGEPARDLGPVDDLGGLAIRELRPFGDVGRAADNSDWIKLDPETPFIVSTMGLKPSPSGEVNFTTVAMRRFKALDINGMLFPNKRF